MRAAVALFGPAPWRQRVQSAAAAAAAPQQRVVASEEGFLLGGTARLYFPETSHPSGRFSLQQLKPRVPCVLKLPAHWNLPVAQVRAAYS